jgi:hypothetical protein
MVYIATIYNHGRMKNSLKSASRSIMSMELDAIHSDFTA